MYLETPEITNGYGGAYGSGGSMRNPMYQKVCARGCYVPASGRCKRRYSQKGKGICLSNKKQFWEL